MCRSLVRTLLLQRRLEWGACLWRVSLSSSSHGGRRAFAAGGLSTAAPLWVSLRSCATPPSPSPSAAGNPISTSTDPLAPPPPAEQTTPAADSHHTDKAASSGDVPVSDADRAEHEEEEEWTLAEEEETFVAEKPPRTKEEDLEREQRRKLRVAEDSLRVEELLSRKNINKYVYVVQVSTPTGVRWVDVWAKPALWQNRVLARQPETQFVAYVAKALQEGPMRPDMFTSTETAGALPSVQVHENWVCLTLRAVKDPYHKRQARSAALTTLNTLSGQSASGSGGGSGSSSAAPRLSAIGAAAQAEPTPPLPSVDDRRGRRRKWSDEDKKATYRSGNGAGNAGRTQASDRTGYEDPASYYYYYNEDTNQFQVLSHRPREGGRLSLLSLFSPWRSIRARENRRFAEYRKRTGKDAEKAYTTMTAPTITEDTERLDIFLMKEVHPLERENHKKKPIPRERIDTATKIGRLERDEYGNSVFNLTSAPRKARRTGEADADVKATTAAATATGGTDTPSERSAADGKAPNDKAALPPIKGSENDPESNLRLRWVVVTIHREPIPFVADTVLRWQEFLAHGGRLPSEDNTDTIQRFFTRNREVGWEEIVRHLLYEDVRGLKHASVAQTRALEILEMELFDDNVHSSAHMRRRRNMLRELHLLSRRAKLYTDVLKESSIAYKQLKKTVDSPLYEGDRNALSLIDSSVSLSQSIEDQSASLLVLQFSVAMYQMEFHLRTLTIFSTFFTPISFIVSFFSMNFPSLEEFSNQDYGIVVFLALLAVASLTTSRWISRNVT